MDPIADMLIRIKNAQSAKKPAATFGYSKFKWEIAKLLERAQYIGAVARKGRKNKKLIEIDLLYDNNGVGKILGVRRISKLGRRVYCGAKEIFRVKNGFGARVYSTPKGLLTDQQAKKEKIGGEVLFEIW